MYQYVYHQCTCTSIHISSTIWSRFVVVKLIVSKMRATFMIVRPNTINLDYLNYSVEYICIDVIPMTSSLYIYIYIYIYLFCIYNILYPPLSLRHERVSSLRKTQWQTSLELIPSFVSLYPERKISAFLRAPRCGSKIVRLRVAIR